MLQVWQVTRLNSVVGRYQADVHKIRVMKAALGLSKEILEFFGPSLIKFATFIVPNVIVCCLVRARGKIENRIVGPGVLLNFPLLRQFSICAFLHSLEIGGVSCLKKGT
jgi:hypothetical protein